MAEKLSLVDMIGIGNLLEPLVAEDIITCEAVSYTHLDNAAHFIIKIFWFGSPYELSKHEEKKRSTFLSSPDDLPSEPPFPYHMLSCIQTDISICKASKPDSLITRSITTKFWFSACKAERVTCHAAGNADGANGRSCIGRLPYPK